MAVEVDELYSHLNKLLDDICKFLTDEANYEKLSPYARKQADELISRSKKQLQEIAKITESDEYDGAYVDMEKKSETNNEEDKNNIYSSVEESAVITPPPVLLPQSNPYANLPAKDLSLNFKYGSLSWKCKIILKFEKIRRIYAGVHDNWLLVYSSEKDGKPLQTFNLKFHKAQIVASKQNTKNLPQDFELICTLGERKTYYFLATTHKDMLQWISHINRCYDKLNSSENVTTNSEDDISETYDFVPEINKQDLEEDEDDIYHDIETYLPQGNAGVENKPPDLPARRCIIKPNTPLPPVPQKEEDDSSDSSIYDPVINRQSIETNSSFSEDTEDDIYEPFVQKPAEPKPQFNGTNDKQKPNITFIHSNKPVLNPRPPPVTGTKPKLLEKPRHFLRKN